DVQLEGFDPRAAGALPLHRLRFRVSAGVDGVSTLGELERRVTANPGAGTGDENALLARACHCDRTHRWDAVADTPARHSIEPRGVKSELLWPRGRGQP